MGITSVSKMIESLILVRWGVNIKTVAVYGILKYWWLYQLYLNPWEAFYNNSAYFYIKLLRFTDAVMSNVALEKNLTPPPPQMASLLCSC